MGLPKKLKLELVYVYLLKVYGLVQLIFIFKFLNFFDELECLFCKRAISKEII